MVKETTQKKLRIKLFFKIVEIFININHKFVNMIIYKN